MSGSASLEPNKRQKSGQGTKTKASILYYSFNHPMTFCIAALNVFFVSYRFVKLISSVLFLVVGRSYSRLIKFTMDYNLTVIAYEENNNTHAQFIPDMVTTTESSPESLNESLHKYESKLSETEDYLVGLYLLVCGKSHLSVNIYSPLFSFLFNQCDIFFLRLFYLPTPFNSLYYSTDANASVIG